MVKVVASNKERGVYFWLILKRIIRISNLAYIEEKC